MSTLRQWKHDRLDDLLDHSAPASTARGTYARAKEELRAASGAGVVAPGR